MLFAKREMVEQFTNIHGDSKAVFLVSPDFVPMNFRNDGIYEFEIVETRKCKIPIESNCPQNAKSAFLDWYRNHSDAVEDLLEYGTSARNIYFPSQTIPTDEYPVDNLTYIRELPSDEIEVIPNQEKEDNNAL